MNRLGCIAVASCLCCLMGAGLARAQGRGGAVWTTAGNDAQRTSAVRTDARISTESLGRPGFQLLWKRQLDAATGPSGLTQPVFSAPGFITYKGFKGLAYVGGGSNAVYAIDYDLNRTFWSRKLDVPATPGSDACPAGLTAITEVTQLAPVGPLRLGGPPAGRAAASPAAGPAPARAGGGGAAAPAGRGGRGRGGAGGGRGSRNAVSALYVASSDGMLRGLNLMDGTDWFLPAQLLPAANAKIAGAILADNTMYVGTAGNCGGVPNGVYAMDLTPAPGPVSAPGSLPLPPPATPASTAVTRWVTNGGDVVGMSPALGTDGTVYVATGDGDYSSTAFSDSIVALEPGTLEQKDYFTPGKTPFTTSPVIFQLEGRELIAAANQDGRVYVLDPASLGGADHKTPLASFDAASPAVQRITGLATIEADSGRWIVMACTWIGSPQTPKDFVAAGQLTLENAVVSFDRRWISPQTLPQLTPAIANGVVFGLSAGERSSAGTPARNAVLYALDLATGKQLWDSGTAIQSVVGGVGPAVDDGQVYVVGKDGALYTFGFVVER
jgi:PQQ-like domain